MELATVGRRPPTQPLPLIRETVFWEKVPRTSVVRGVISYPHPKVVPELHRQVLVTPAVSVGLRKDSPLFRFSFDTLVSYLCVSSVIDRIVLVIRLCVRVLVRRKGMGRN